MTGNSGIIITITGMALVTYLTRISGFYLSDRLTHMPPAVGKFLQYIPGTIIVSIIAPQIISGGTVTLAAALVCVGAAVLSRQIVVVMIIGVATVSLLRNFIFT